ncbi:MAG: metal-dependent hydrolase [Desulfurococcales archaeon]|nr:metal-dependent hydrolase [Desulfurococcales archaeon]
MGYLKYYGHSAFELYLDGKKILIDPWLTHPMKVEEPSNLENVNYIILTHGHDDHVGDTIEIMENNPEAKVVAIFELANYIAEKLGDTGRGIGANMGGPVLLDGLKAAFVPANHSSPIGSPTGVIVMGKEATIYHAGDTSIASEMELIGKIYKPDIAILPIGGHFTMDPVEAAYAVDMIKPKVAIPMHYKTFPVLYGTPEEFRNLVKEKAPGVKVVVLNPGDVWNIEV